MIPIHGIRFIHCWLHDDGRVVFENIPVIGCTTNGYVGPDLILFAKREVISFYRYLDFDESNPEDVYIGNKAAIRLHGGAEFAFVLAAGDELTMSERTEVEARLQKPRPELSQQIPATDKPVSTRADTPLR